MAAARSLGLNIRVGIHTGEYEQVAAGVRGLAVHVAARVMATAGTDEIRISAATATLLDPGVRLRPLGVHELKGVPKPVEIFTVESPG